MRFLAVVGWLLVLTLPAQILAAPAEAKTAIVTGRVMSASGDFLEDVSITVLAPSKGAEPSSVLAEAKTDKEGRYTIRVAVPGESLLARIRFEKTGYISSRSIKSTEAEQSVEILLIPGQTARACHAFKNPVHPYFIPKSMPVEQRPKSATISGRVIDETGEPLEGVLVRAGRHWERHITVSERYKFSETKTGKDGRYELQIPMKPGVGMMFGIDATKPQRRSAWGTNRSQDNHLAMLLTAGTKKHVSFWLPPGLYVKGIVLDPSGAPASGAYVTANVGGGVSGIRVKSLKTGSDGNFELFDYPLQPERSGSTVLKAEVRVWKQDFLSSTVNDLYALSPQERANLRLVLSKGHELSGRVVDAAGTPVKNLIIEASYPDIANRRAALTDDAGRFTLQVLETGNPEIRAHAFALKQKIKQAVQVPETKEIELKLQPVALKPGLKTYRLLGMTLADLTGELREYYDIDPVHFGVIVLDPGKEIDRLGLSEMTEGTCIHSVGFKPIMNVNGFAKTLLADATSADLNAHRISFSARKVKHSAGIRPKIILTESDVTELKQVLPTIEDTKRNFPFLGVAPTGTETCVVQSVVAESPADKAGMQPGDVILKIDSQAVQGANEFLQRIKKSQAGKKVSIEIRRGDETLTLEATL